MKFLQKMNPISFRNNRIFNKFGGRLGNNITQLANIIVIAIASALIGLVLLPFLKGQQLS